MPSVYAYPKLSRSGLGNMLITWARCEIFRQRADVPMVAPRWVHIRLGPLVRRERDKRFYIGLFSARGYVRGYERLRLLVTARRLSEFDSLSPHTTDRPSLVVFQGIDGLFQPLLTHHNLVRSRLERIITHRVRRCLDTGHEPFTIGVHIRRGDKPQLAYGEPQIDALRSLPLEWFAKVIQQVRDAVGSPAPVRIFSEASASELYGLLALGGVTIAPPAPSIADILLLARSRILITTAHSTFSSWASYLGQMPTIWYPGGATVLNPARPDLQIESDLQGNLPADAAAILRNTAAPALNAPSRLTL